MNKIKLIAFLGTISLLLCSAFGCTKPIITGNTDYIAYEVSKYPMWELNKVNSYQDATAPSEKTVVFNGKTYTGQYSCSVVKIPDTYVSHLYRGEEAFFDVNAVTGELVDILIIKDSSENGIKDETECRRIADEFVKSYISLEDYTIEIKEISGDAYAFTYYRKINDYKTSDRLMIAVNKNGNIKSFGVTELGTFDGVNTVSIDEDKALETIDKKLNDIYASKADSMEYSFYNKELVKLEDEKIVILYTISLQFVTETDEVTDCISEQVKLFLTIS